MANPGRAFADLGTLERLAHQDSPLHRLDPRTRIITTFIFILTTVSFDRYAVLELLPLFLFPVAIIALANISPLYLARQLLLLSPFVIFVGIFNPLLDSHPVRIFDTVEIAAGWISFCSLMLRFLLTAGSALLLMATGGIMGLGMGLQKLLVPGEFVIQLLLLYRFIFLLLDEANRMIMARNNRTFNGRGRGPRVAASMIGTLLLRTIARAERVHQAMLGRGFRGELRAMKDIRFAASDFFFLAGWCSFFAIVRLVNLPDIVGSLIIGL